MDNTSEIVFYNGAVQSYDTTKLKPLNTLFQPRVDTDTVDAYVDETNRRVLITIRGTYVKDMTDLLADGSLPFNQLKRSKRFKKDYKYMIKIMNMFPPNQYTYFMTGHSLGVSIMSEFHRMFPFIKYSVAYNGAFQPKDFTSNPKNIKRYYMNKDFLYRSGGFMFNPKQVLQYSPNKQNRFLQYLYSNFDPTIGLKAHSLSNFKSYYGGCGKEPKCDCDDKKIIDIISKVK